MAHQLKDNAIEMHAPIERENSPSRDGVGGTSQDRIDMKRLGKKQELNASISTKPRRDVREPDYLQRNFHSLSILGLTCVIMCTWMGILSYVSPEKTPARIKS